MANAPTDNGALSDGSSRSPRVSLESSAAFHDAASEIPASASSEYGSALDGVHTPKAGQSQASLPLEATALSITESSLPKAVPVPVLPASVLPVSADPALLEKSLHAPAKIESAAELQSSSSTKRESSSGDGAAKIDMDTAELAHLTPAQRKIILDQTWVPKARKAGLFELYRCSFAFA